MARMALSVNGLHHDIEVEPDTFSVRIDGEVVEPENAGGPSGKASGVLGLCAPSSMKGGRDASVDHTEASTKPIQATAGSSNPVAST